MGVWDALGQGISVGLQNLLAGYQLKSKKEEAEKERVSRERNEAENRKLMAEARDIQRGQLRLAEEEQARMKALWSPGVPGRPADIRPLMIPGLGGVPEPTRGVIGDRGAQEVPQGREHLASQQDLLSKFVPSTQISIFKEERTPEGFLRVTPKTQEEINAAVTAMKDEEHRMTMERIREQKSRDKEEDTPVRLYIHDAQGNATDQIDPKVFLDSLLSFVETRDHLRGVPLKTIFANGVNVEDAAMFFTRWAGEVGGDYERIMADVSRQIQLLIASEISTKTIEEIYAEIRDKHFPWVSFVSQQNYGDLKIPSDPAEADPLDDIQGAYQKGLDILMAENQEVRAAAARDRELAQEVRLLEEMQRGLALWPKNSPGYEEIKAGVLLQEKKVDELKRKGAPSAAAPLSSQLEGFVEGGGLWEWPEATPAAEPRSSQDLWEWLPYQPEATPAAAPLSSQLADVVSGDDLWDEIERWKKERTDIGWEDLYQLDEIIKSMRREIPLTDADKQLIRRLRKG